MQPSVSIVMPAFNSENSLPEAVESVLKQTFESWELIIIDDGSTDSTFEIMKSLSNRDNRIKIHKNKNNIGVSETRNRAFKLSIGEWTAFLDSDDLWEPTKLEKQLALADQKKAEFIFTGVTYIDENNASYDGLFNVPNRITYKELRKQNVISCSSVLVKSKYFKEIKMERDDMHEDYAVWLRILKSGIGAYGLDEPLLIYRISKDSKSGNKLKTIPMTYKVFRFIGYGPFKSFYFMSSHIVNSLTKYRKIYNKVS